MDKVAAKKLLLKDINTFIIHLDDIVDSETAGIDSSQYHTLSRAIEQIKSFVEDDLILFNADEVDKPKVTDEDEEDFFKELSKVYSDAQNRRSSSTDSCGSSSSSSCGSGYSWSGGCGGSSGRGC